jgi:tetratricopeptide (TPR) repeat protein
MSANNNNNCAVKEEEDEYVMCCASCGVGEVDDIKLKTCTACKSVRYCSVKCQRDHRPKHKKACKKRAAELRDEILFKQPESSHLGDCPICCLPLSLGPNNKSSTMACFSKLICIGCDYANYIREMEQKIEHKCPFCRHPTAKSKEEADRNRMKRVEVNDPVALLSVGIKRYDDGDYRSAFEYLSKSAELGDVSAHYTLSNMYRGGAGVEKDEKKKLYHLEVAANGGHDFARYNLGAIEYENGRHERAVKHWIIAAKLGYDDSLDALKEGFMMGLVSKEAFAAALRGHQAAVDATKTLREEGEAFLRRAMAAKAARQN